VGATKRGKELWAKWGLARSVHLSSYSHPLDPSHRTIHPRPPPPPHPALCTGGRWRSQEEEKATLGRRGGGRARLHEGGEGGGGGGGEGEWGIVDEERYCGDCVLVFSLLSMPQPASVFSSARYHAPHTTADATVLKEPYQLLHRILIIIFDIS
jgi:hypothetical protein